MSTASQKVLPVCCSAFFRPAEAFAALKAWVVEDLLDRVTPERPARIWIAACATGEETYSIAMLLIEHFEAYGRAPSVRIFATDADPHAIQAARAGMYAESDLIGLSAERLQRFFHRHSTSQFRVNAGLRDGIVFATHDLDHDPPLSQLDFISCRNVPSQLAPESRKRLDSMLHFALNEGGHVLLGPTETFVPSSEFFTPVDAEGYVYKRVGKPNDPVQLQFLAASVEAAYSGRNSPWPSCIPRRLAGALLTAEEFQSAHEDLVTSKERLQSLNEELIAVNSQLTEKLAALDRAHADTLELLGATNIAILFLDAHQCVREFTAPAAQLLGLRASDVGRHWRAAARGFDEQLIIDAQLAVQARIPIEKSVRHADTCRCYLRRVQMLHPDTGVAVTFVDITEQVESDAQLQRFAAMLRDSADAIIVMDFGGWIIAWNRGAQRLYGYTQAEALELNVRDLTTGELFDSTLEAMRSVARGERMPAFDTQRRTRSGRIIDVSATVALLFDAAGNPESLASTERDITARRRAEDETRMLNVKLEQRVAEGATELQHSEDQIKAILDATADAVVTIDVLGRIATFNRAAERTFGYSATEVIGESVTILMPPEERVGRYGYKTMAAGSLVSRLTGRSQEISGRRKDGSIFPIQLSVNSVEGRDLFVGVARDMTEHKALQKEIIDVATLEQRRIGQELHDGTQQELTGLGLLAVNLADSLNRNGSNAASQVAARIARGIEQCNQRVRSLARGMVPVPIDRQGLMTALAELARQTTEIHGLPCSFQCPTPVEIDNDNEATHLYRMAQEAISNATRHAKASAVWIRLQQAGGRLVLEVQDNGVGLPPTAVPGKGVGLRLMEHRCAMIGGNFTVDTRPDGGTCIACSVSRAEVT